MMWHSVLGGGRDNSKPINSVSCSFLLPPVALIVETLLSGFLIVTRDGEVFSRMLAHLNANRDVFNV